MLVRETEEKETQLKRAVGALDLTALGLGAIIGTGIFVIIGEAITTSGPSIILALRPRRRDLHLLRAGVRRASLVDPGLRQRLHLLLRHPRRALRPGSSAGI